MRTYKRRIIIWTIIAALALIAIIGLSIFIHQLGYTIELNKKVELDRSIIDAFQFSKAYSIGGLAFSCVVFIIGVIISYAGFKSWKYSEMFS
ncbi:hypothetical protein ACXYRQ_00520 [Mycoplasma sp. 394]